MLLDAVKNGKLTDVQKLINPFSIIDEIAEVRYCNSDGHSAIHIAVINDKTAIFKKLLEYDKTLLTMKTEDALSEYPLHLAVKK